MIVTRRRLNTTWQRRLGLGLLAPALALAALVLAASGALADAGRVAFVEPDATLRIGQKTVRLFGIYIPEMGRTCDTLLRPSRCGTRAAIALERKIQGLVYCKAVSRNRDRSVNAVCTIDGAQSRLNAREDLAAFLLREGWAVALPGAPFAYVTLERIARARGRGIWGLQADSITLR